MAAALAAAALLAGCGGGDGDRGPSYTRLLSFGDSLSDVGTYRTAGMQQFYGGGQFTINTPQRGGNWTEQLARELALAPPCAARTGSNATPDGRFPVLAEATVDHLECSNYAQGGARVTNPIGPGNVLLPAAAGGDLGLLTEPVAQQLQRHLARSATPFASGDLVTVLAGGNDAIMLSATEAPADAVRLMGQAGQELAALVSQMLARGAQRVVLVNLPDIGVSARAVALEAQQPGARALFTQMSAQFNAPLAAAFANEPRVLLVNAFAASQAQAANPALYGLENTTVPACTVSTALLCSEATLQPGLTAATRYWFSDDIHLTPYGYQLLARVVTDAMTRAGWLNAYGERPCNGPFRNDCTLAPLPQPAG